MDILEDREGWRSRYLAWLEGCRQTGVVDWRHYPIPKNTVGPSGKGIDLSQSRLMLISSAGAYLRDGQVAFDADDPLGDYGHRLISSSVPLGALGFAHGHYDHAAVDQDPQVLVPLRHLETMVTDRQIGELTASMVSFMGYLPDVTRLIDESFPFILEAARAEKADGVLLVPA